MADVETPTNALSALDMSLDERIAASKSSTNRRSEGAGGARRTDRSGARKARTGGQPYAKREMLPYRKGDSEGRWGHDLYGSSTGGQLGSRLSNSGSGSVGREAEREEKSGGSRGRVDFSGVRGLLDKGLSVRGAGEKTGGKVVRVENLMEGTTAADVEAIFKDAGPIISSKLVKSKPTVSVELNYKTPADAEEAVRKFDGQVADGLTIKVYVVSPPSASAGGRGGGDLLSRVSGGVGGGVKRDLLDDGDGGSKLRSDALLDAPGALVVSGDAFSGGRRGGGAGGGRWKRGGRP